MNMGEPNEGEHGLLRGVAGIVLAGLALGIAFNALQLASGPRRGLAWIKHEVKLASLESLGAEASAAPIEADTSTAGATADSSGGTAVATHPDSARSSSRHRGKAPSPGAKAPVAHGAKGGSGTSPTAAVKAGEAASATGHAAPAATAELPTVPDTKEPLEVQYPTIKKFWDAGAALFVDARSAEEYAEGHIPGAVSLPFDDVFKDPERARALDTHGHPVVITYCGGGDCDLSRNLAFSLIDAGHKKVLVFLGGIPGWKDAGNSIATGATPGAAPSWPR